MNSLDFAVPSGISRTAAIAASGLSFEVVEDEDRPLVDREAAKRGVEEARIVVGAAARRGVTRERVHLGRRDLPNAAPAAGTERHSRRVHRDALEPRLELVRVAESGQLSPRGDERLLGGVASVGLVIEDRAGQSVHGIHPATNDRLERIEVAVACPVDDRPVNRGSDRRNPPCVH